MHKLRSLLVMPTSLCWKGFGGKIELKEPGEQKLEFLAADQALKAIF